MEANEKCLYSVNSGVMFDSGYNVTYLLIRLSVSTPCLFSTISFFIWRQAYFRDPKLLFQSCKQFCMHILYKVEHISGNT